MKDEAKIDEQIREMNEQLAEQKGFTVEADFDRREVDYDAEQIKKEEADS